MYRINDKSAAIRLIQIYLRLVGNKEIFVAPSGEYDENTRKSVKDFQKTRKIKESGVVDYKTFTSLYAEYIAETRKRRTQKENPYASFPIFPGDYSDILLLINRQLSRLLDSYGITHRIRENSFYSAETSDAVEYMREIFNLKTGDYIDEELYDKILKDSESIAFLNKNNFVE